MTKDTIGYKIGQDISTATYVPSEKFKDKQPLANPNQIVGVELEVENVPGTAQTPPGFAVHQDGSLRNNGLEWITLPIKSEYLRELLTQFFNLNKFTERNYSERCSIHVHANVQDFTMIELKNLVILYQVFENVLFEFIGHDRKNNIFCVPWNQSSVNYSLIETMDNKRLARWAKYTALNLQPVFGGGDRRALGTVEFRHMEGHCDVTRIMNWINLIGCLTRAAKEISYKDLRDTILDLNTSSAYDVFLRTIFREWTGLITNSKDYKILLEMDVINAKLLLMGKHDLEALRRDEQKYFETLVAEEAPPPPPHENDFFQVNEPPAHQQIIREALENLRRRPQARVIRDTPVNPAPPNQIWGNRAEWRAELQDAIDQDRANAFPTALQNNF